MVAVTVGMMMAVALGADGHLPFIKKHSSPDDMFRLIVVASDCPVTYEHVRALVDSGIIGSRLQPRDQA